VARGLGVNHETLRHWIHSAHGIDRITRLVTDNGAGYRSGVFAHAVGDVGPHQRIRPFTPRHNGKVERYQRILAEELLCAPGLDLRTPAC
jgi:transposase InsO family protein